MFTLNLKFLYSLIEELRTKEDDDKTDCNFNFGHQSISKVQNDPYTLSIEMRYINVHVFQLNEILLQM